MHSKVMMVLVRSWKNATKQHNQGSKTNENASFKFENALIPLNLYYYIHYSSFCDEGEHQWRPVPKPLHFDTHAARMPASTRSMARQISLHKKCLKKHLTTKNKGLQALDNFSHKPRNVRRAMFYTCIIDRQKPLKPVQWNYGAKSLQTFQHACSVGFCKFL